MIRILDRQRYWAFLKAYVISFVSLVGLYVVIDAFSNIDEFTKITSGIGPLFRHMGNYYLVRLSFFYDRLCGVITMLAAIFTVTWMQKNNELVAMLAAGISATRAIRPVLISALIVSALAVLNQELVIPRVSDALQRTPDDDGLRPILAASRFDANEVQLQGHHAFRTEMSIDHFHALLPASRFGALMTLDAKAARYVPETASKRPLRGGWLLWGAVLSPAEAKPDGQILIEVKPDQIGKFPRYPQLDARGSVPKPPPGRVMFLKTDITFANISRRADWYQFADTGNLVHALADAPSRSERAKMGVFLHGRVVRPLTSMILLLLSLPLVLGGEGRNMFMNLGLSLGTSAVFYGVSFLVNYLGGSGVMSPELAAWVPIIGFGTLAAARWDNIRS